MMQKSIAVLITCHNRASQTIHCLKQLFNQRGLGHEFILDLYLVDDNSSDGTADLIHAQFPLVNIIKGTGELYWNRGMHLAWETAAEKGTYTWYLWLNDDTFLHDNALSCMISVDREKSIVVGATTGQKGDEITYGGFSRKHQLLVPNNKAQECSYFNGNCVLIPKIVFEKVGNLDTLFHHALGDFDYGLRATKKGIQLVLAPIPIGTCEEHTEVPTWSNHRYNLVERLKNLYSPLSGCSPSEFFKFENRHYGISMAVLHFCTMHLRALFPYVNKLRPLSKQ